MSTEPKTVKIPISNIFTNGDYTAQIFVGSENTPANVILDTGSSTIAVKESAYQPEKDEHLKPTSLCQDITYGSGGWAGPVILTSVALGVKGNRVALSRTPLAIAAEQQQGNLGRADGILGLAYHALNSCYDLKSFLTKHKISPPVTYPWRFGTVGGGFTQFKQTFLPKMRAQPKTDITPYFDQLEKKGIVANKMAFYTLRSSVHVAAAGESLADAIEDPLNQGHFVMGGGEEETAFYKGSFTTVKVLHDAFYNTNLKSVRVEGGDPVQVPPLQRQYRQYDFTNSIIDSGTNSLQLAFDLYQKLFESLGKLNRRFTESIVEFGRLITQRTRPQGLPVEKLDLEKWPDIHFVLEGDGGQDVTLSCSPETYWQVNFPMPGQAFFKIRGVAQGGPNHSILGLPLMNNYYTIFDRSIDRLGVIKFAPIKRPSA